MVCCTSSQNFPYFTLWCYRDALANGAVTYPIWNVLLTKILKQEQLLMHRSTSGKTRNVRGAEDSKELREKTYLVLVEKYIIVKIVFMVFLDICVRFLLIYTHLSKLYSYEG